MNMTVVRDLTSLDLEDAKQDCIQARFNFIGFVRCKARLHKGDL
jgi:hypothetical protein